MRISKACILAFVAAALAVPATAMAQADPQPGVRANNLEYSDMHYAPVQQQQPYYPPVGPAYYPAAMPYGGPNAPGGPESPFANAVQAEEGQADMAAEGGYEGDYGDGGAGCGGGCGNGCGGGCTDCCFFDHMNGGFGEFLFLQARGVDVAFAQPRDGVNLATSAPFGPVAVANPDYSPGFRTGFFFALDRCTSVGISYTQFDSSTFSDIAVTQNNLRNPLVIHSLITHPATASAASDSLRADAIYGVDFKLIDLDYRRIWSRSQVHAINWNVGLRYAKLDQDLLTGQPISPGVTSVFSNIDFWGLGFRCGLDAQRRIRQTGLAMYGKTFASFLAGHFDSNYTQANSFALTQVATSWKDDRIVPILEYEVGLSWQSAQNRVRLSTGYMVAAWFNAVTTPEFVQAVRTSNFVNLGDTITFDGWTNRVELRW